MKVKFTKMHGAGNDFVIIDACSQKLSLTEHHYRFIANRRFGIGADQILVVEPSQISGVDFRYRIFNADGGEVEQCGNGARAFAVFVTQTGMTKNNPIRVQTKAGIIELCVNKDHSVTVDMGKPIFDTNEIPFNCQGLTPKTQYQDTLWPLSIDALKQNIWVSVVSMGNPHAVEIVADIDQAPVLEQGPLIENHPSFPNRVNAGFMQILNRNEINLRVYERGAGETLACGTGSCAAVISGIRRGLLDSPVTVHARGGNLKITWEGVGHNVMMTGPAVIVFTGEIEI